MRMLFLCWILAIANAASASTPYEMKHVALLQPDFVLQERIAADALAAYIAADALAAYIASVNAAALDVLAGQTYEPAGGFLVLAVRPGRQSAAWLDIRPALPPGLARALVARLRAVPAPTVEVGPVVFAVSASLSGGDPRVSSVPLPEAWAQAIREAGKPIATGDLVERIWPR